MNLKNTLLYQISILYIYIKIIVKNYIGPVSIWLTKTAVLKFFISSSGIDFPSQITVQDIEIPMTEPDSSNEMVKESERLDSKRQHWKRR